MAEVVRHLGLKSLHAIVGASYGGMVALAFAERHAALVERIVVLSAADRSQALSTAWRCVQRQIVREALERGDGPSGLRLARALAMTTYRSAVGICRTRSARRRSAVRIDFDSRSRIICSRAATATSRGTARESFLTLSESIDLFAIDAARVRTPATLLAVRQDLLVPLADMQRVRRPSRRPLPAVRNRFDFRSRCVLERGRGIETHLGTGAHGGHLNDEERSPRKLTTRTVRAGLESDTQFGAVVAPIYLTSNFAFDGFRQQRSKYDYTRSGNPTRDQLAEALTDLEGGFGAVVTCTGMAAIALDHGDLAGRRASRRSARLLWRHISGC